VEVNGAATTSYLERITQGINKMTISQLLNIYYFYCKNYCRVRENKLIESIIRPRV